MEYKIFTDKADFFRFIDNYEADLRIINNKVYDGLRLIAEFKAE